uniref:G2/mitotic-specific cyclin-B2-like n=1 Tax=Monopterus albus TaxID=43700 RepID=UPI0009B4D8B5|nr:G2/mitotic-specific cyclin-B2-like [Monopterus albus]
MSRDAVEASCDRDLKEPTVIAVLSQIIQFSEKSWKSHYYHQHFTFKRSSHPQRTQGRWTQEATAVRRAALGERTNFPGAAVNTKRTGPAKASAKPSCDLKVNASAVVPPVVQVQAPADPLPSVSEESADASMEEELCQAFSEALLTVQDVDEQDADLPQLCV